MGGAAARGAAKVVAYGLLIVVVLVAVLAFLGRPPARTPGIQSDSLGPESGEPVPRYLERAAVTLHEDDQADRWALVSFWRAVGGAEAAESVAGAPRVSRVIAQVPRDGVAMPLLCRDLPEPLEGDRAAVLDAALERLAAHDPINCDGTRGPAFGRDRAALARLLTDDRIRAGEPAVIALVLRAPTPTLRGIAARPDVRGIEALPADAEWGRFSLRPLLPQQLDRADPLRDDAPLEGE